ncbi:MAG: TetR/AcrR family transcriptional regulator [Pontixanthobacter sp.]
MKTRDRIIQQARMLFNADGYGQVTTAGLAAACGIAEGNLWYHFKTKRDLLDAIGQNFAAEVEVRLAMVPDPADPLGSYCDLLGGMMHELREYRFLYRDQPSYGEHAEPIASHIGEWLERTHECLALHLAALVRAGLLDWPEDRLRELAINATVILRFGLEYRSELGEKEGGVRKTLLQHLTLFEHRLIPEAAEQIRDAIEQIGKGLKAAA